MRFFWLAMAIITPLIAVVFIESESNTNIQLTYLIVACVVQVITISFTISEFIRLRKRETEAEHARIKQERDKDIQKWRKEFHQDTLHIYDIQKESLIKAMELNDPLTTRSRFKRNSESTNDNESAYKDGQSNSNLS